MKKQILMIVLLISGATAFGGTLKKKLATHNEKIQMMKQKARSGESADVNNQCVDCNSACRECGSSCSGCTQHTCKSE
jgi:hypothetical protein